MTCERCNDRPAPFASVHFGIPQVCAECFLAKQDHLIRRPDRLSRSKELRVLPRAA